MTPYQFILLQRLIEAALDVTNYGLTVGPEDRPLFDRLRNAVADYLSHGEPDEHATGLPSVDASGPLISWRTFAELIGELQKPGPA